MEGDLKEIKFEVGSLILEIETSIAEADAFIKIIQD